MDSIAEYGENYGFSSEDVAEMVALYQEHGDDFIHGFNQPTRHTISKSIVAKLLAGGLFPMYLQAQANALNMRVCHLSSTRPGGGADLIAPVDLQTLGIIQSGNYMVTACADPEGPIAPGGIQVIVNAGIPLTPTVILAPVIMFRHTYALATTPPPCHPLLRAAAVAWAIRTGRTPSGAPTDLPALLPAPARALAATASGMSHLAHHYLSQALLRIQHAEQHRDDLDATVLAYRRTIPKPRNCFIIYRQDKIEEVTGQHGKMHASKASKIISNMWATESDAVKQHYQTLAEKEKADHQKKYPAWLAAPRRASNIRRRVQVLTAHVAGPHQILRVGTQPADTSRQVFHAKQAKVAKVTAVTIHGPGHARILKADGSSERLPGPDGSLQGYGSIAHDGVIHGIYGTFMVADPELQQK